MTFGLIEGLFVSDSSPAFQSQQSPLRSMVPFRGFKQPMMSAFQVRQETPRQAVGAESASEKGGSLAQVGKQQVEKKLLFFFSRGGPPPYPPTLLQYMCIQWTLSILIPSPFPPNITSITPFTECPKRNLAIEFFAVLRI